MARRNQTAETIAQKVHPVGREKKKALLSHLIKSGNWHQVLVFTRMKHGANRLTDYLNDQGITAMAIHGNKSQTARTKALADFKKGDLQVLVATDIAARGIDIDQLPHVVNFEMPNVPEDYVHRIGRTGRAGASGLAVTLVASSDTRLVADIEHLIKKKIEIEPLELDDGPPPREYRDRARHDRGDEIAAVPEAAQASAPQRAHVPAARSASYAAPRAPSDPFFDKPYEASASAVEPAWENKTPAAPRGMSPNIKPKKRVAALFGAKVAEREPEPVTS